MPGYDRHYDYGMRGFRQTTHSVRGTRYGSPSYDQAYNFGRDERHFGGARLPNRVTARYNMDYVVGDRHDYGRDYRNFSMYGGDRMERMGDARWYRQPYMTIGGTHTLRGARYPTGYDYPDYGPNYGGRYPDEL